MIVFKDLSTRLRPVIVEFKGSRHSVFKTGIAGGLFPLTRKKEKYRGNPRVEQGMLLTRLLI